MLALITVNPGLITSYPYGILRPPEVSSECCWVWPKNNQKTLELKLKTHLWALRSSSPRAVFSSWHFGSLPVHQAPSSASWPSHLLCQLWLLKNDQPLVCLSPLELQSYVREWSWNLSLPIRTGSGHSDMEQRKAKVKNEGISQRRLLLSWYPD